MSGLAAKDVVDVRVELAVAVDDEDGWLAAGYEVRAREPGHRCLARAEPAEPRANVHVFAAGAPEVAAYLRLREHPADRDRYAALKRSLAEREWPDVNYCAEAKGPLIRELLGVLPPP